MNSAENKESALDTNEVEGFIEKINETLIIENENSKITMKGLVGGILKYDKNGISTRFFGENKETVTQDDIDSFIVYAKKIYKAFDQLKKSLNKSNFSSEMKKFLHKKMVEQQKICQLTQYAVYFEAEKGNSSYTIPEGRTDFYLSKVEEISQDIWGGRVDSRPLEIQGITQYLQGLNDENGVLQNFLQDIVLSGENNIVSEKTYDSPLMRKFLKREDYMKVLALNYQLQGFDVIYISTHPGLGRPVIEGNTYTFPEGFSSNERNDFLQNIGVLSNEKHMKIIETYVSPKGNMVASTSSLYNYTGIKIPTNTLYDALIIEKVLVYLDHEQATHGSRGHGMLYGIKQSSAGYLPTEESIAMANENLVFRSPKSIETVNPTEHNVTKLICEKLSADDAIPVITAYYKAAKMYPGEENKKAIARVERMKRLGPRDLPYALAKDNAYNMHVLEFIDSIMSMDIAELQNIVKKLYSGKRSKDDIDIIEQLNTEVGISHKNVSLPVMLGKLIAVRASGIDHKELSNEDSEHYDPRFMLGIQRTKGALKIILEAENIIHNKSFVQ